MATTLPRTRLRCRTCEAFLASDNAGPLCSPCHRSAVLARFAPEGGALPAVNVVEARAVFGHGGLPALAHHLECSLHQALDLCLVHNLVRPILDRRAATLHHLLALTHLSHVAAATQLGISRFTVATYRRELGLPMVKIRSTVPPLSA